MKVMTFLPILCLTAILRSSSYLRGGIFSGELFSPGTPPPYIFTKKAPQTLGRVGVKHPTESVLEKLQLT